MSSELEAIVAGYSNDHLLTQLYRKRDEYSQAALAIMEKELRRRMLPDDLIAGYRDTPAALLSPGAKAELDRDDFSAFDDLFSPTDILLVNALFEEAKIPFFVDNPDSTVFPTEPQSTPFLAMHVHRDHVAAAHTLLDEHFIKQDGKYRVRFNNDRERLKALNFHELHAGDPSLDAELGAALAPAEIEAVIAYGRRLLTEVDTIEKEQDRIVFYYDTIEELIDRLQSDPEAGLSKSHFLTVTEILQIYCEDPAFPAVLNDTVAAILAFFEKR